MKIAICTSGGDCAGLNAAIAAAVRFAEHKYQVPLWGLKSGLNALLDPSTNLIELTSASVAGITSQGGTILYSANYGSPFRDVSDKKPIIKSMIKTARSLGITHLIVIGGEGSHGIAKELLGNGVTFIGVPKTIDNDMPGNEITIGFKSAVEIAVQSAANIKTTARSHGRFMFLEVMGRDCGSLALEVGLASEAEFILIPEKPYSLDVIISRLKTLIKSGQNYGLGIIAEGAYPLGGGQCYISSSGSSKKKKLGGAAQFLSEQIWEKEGIESRSVVLGHIQRGCPPICDDRLLAQRLGVKAVEACFNKIQSDIVLCINGNVIKAKPYASFDFKARRRVEPSDPILKLAQNFDICLGT